MRGDGIRLMNSKWILYVGITSLLVLISILGGCNKATNENMAEVKYPVKPITVIVPFAAGGGNDIIARTLEKTAIQHLGQPFVIVNKPGGASTIGMNEIARAQPDGYTIGIIGMSAILQPLYGQTRYHYPSALEPLVKVVSTPIIVMVLSNQPWKNLNELIEYAKQHPGELKFGHSGLGTSRHITGELFAKEAGINIVQVPFKGESEALAALLGGHIQLIFADPAIKEHVASGAVRVLGVAESKRLSIPGLDNIPTFQEQGVNIALNFWTGIAAPKGIPYTEKTKLAAGLKEMVNDPEFKKSMADIGMSVEYLGPDEFSDQWIADNRNFANTVKETGIAELITSQKN